MRTFLLPPVAVLLGLAACAQNPPSSNPVATTVPTPATPGGTTSGFSANPPDNMTGSQAYQSPDLDDRSTGRFSARPPANSTGSSQYQSPNLPRRYCPPGGC